MLPVILTIISSHDWADPDSITILNNIKKVMLPTSRIIVHECYNNARLTAPPNSRTEEFVLQSAARETDGEGSLITQVCCHEIVEKA